MDIKLLIIFIVLNIVNVIVQTIKSLATVKCKKTMAAIINAVAYGFYTIVTVYMLCDLPLFTKAFVVAICNLIGVWVVKYFEEKARKDKLWKIEMAISNEYNPIEIKRLIECCNVSCNYYEVGKWIMFNCYCETQEQSAAMQYLAKEYNGKISAYESKSLE